MIQPMRCTQCSQIHRDRKLNDGFQEVGRGGNGVPGHKVSALQDEKSSGVWWHTL